MTGQSTSRAVNQPEEIKMTCTYYGGDTSRFVRNVLTGVKRHEKFPAALKAFQFVKETPRPQRGARLFGVGTTLFAHEDQVLSNRSDFSMHLFVPMDATAKVHKSLKSRINLEFLAQCKLLDMPSYELALKKKRPSPVALVMACEQAKKSVKPDYPANRTYGIELANFIENLVYCELVPEVDPEALDPKRYSEIFWIGSVPVRTLLNGRHAIPGGNWEHFPKELNSREFKSTLNLDYLAEQGLIDLSAYNALCKTGSPMEALQYAVRRALNHPAAMVLESVELPTDFMMDV
jgi:hypothetical protein